MVKFFHNNSALYLIFKIFFKKKKNFYYLYLSIYVLSKNLYKTQTSKSIKLNFQKI